MFNPITGNIDKLARKYPERIKELEVIFSKQTIVYIDFANVVRWQDKLGWHFDLKRLKQLLDSFSTIQKVKFYQGTIVGDTKSESFIDEVENYKYQIITKPVKKIKISIDVSSIPIDSPVILKNFVRLTLLKKLSVEDVEYFNRKLKELNERGILYLEDWKCNFDVEIGRDMLLDYERGHIDNYVLWSGDSDFCDPVAQLLSDHKNVHLFATARRISFELGELTDSGLSIYELKKIKNFICWRREMDK